MESVKKLTVQARAAPPAKSNTEFRLNQLQTLLAVTHNTCPSFSRPYRVCARTQIHKPRTSEGVILYLIVGSL